MLSMLSLQKTPMQAIYESTCLDLIRELSQNLAEDKPTLESFTSIHGLDKCVQEINFSKAVKDLYTKYHNPGIKQAQTEKQQNQTYSWTRFVGDMDISKIGDYDMSINEAVKIAGEVRREVGDMFYGILLSTSGKRKDRTVFNPLHPIIVAELQKEGTSLDLDSQEWSMAIYTWKENSKYKDQFPGLYTEESYIPEIATLITCINSPANYIVENKDFNVDIIDEKFVLNYKEVKRQKDSGEEISEDEAGDRNFMIPGQIINISGVAYPYYNVVYSRKGLAWNMSPMYAANINHPEAQSTNDGMEGGSRICTHSGNSKTQMGVSSLNHCNTTSPLNSYVLEPGAISYAKQCADASLEMLLGEDYTFHGKPKPVLTYQEFISENDGATKAQYLAYVKNRMAENMENGKDGETGEVPGLEIEEPWVPKYPYHNAGHAYSHGEICTDPSMENRETGRTGFRQMTKNGWIDYNEVLADEEPTIETVTTFVSGNTYPIGVIVEHEGRRYEAIIEAALIPKPRDNTVWKDITEPLAVTYYVDDTAIIDGVHYICVQDTMIAPGPLSDEWGVIEQTKIDEADQAEAELAQQDTENEGVA